MSISLCMIVRDEGKILDNFLSRIKSLVDEIIVVDTGSCDDTLDIASRFTDKVYSFQWDGDFSSARNYSLSKANSEWILVLDPDETISGSYFDDIRELTRDNSVIGYKLVQRNYQDERNPVKWRENEGDTDEEFKGYLGWWYRGMVRLFRNDKRIRYEFPVHESVLGSIECIGGKVMSSGIPIYHIYTLDGKEERYYKMLLEKIKKFPTANSFAEIALHCFETGRREEGEKYRRKAINLNIGMKFLDKF